MNTLRLQKSVLIDEINKVEEQIRRIKLMIEDGSICEDILHQITIVLAKLKYMSKLIMESQIKSRLNDLTLSREKKHIDVLLKTIEQLV